jgi:hypothetical protein
MDKRVKKKRRWRRIAVWTALALVVVDHVGESAAMARVSTGPLMGWGLFEVRVGTVRYKVQKASFLETLFGHARIFRSHTRLGGRTVFFSLEANFLSLAMGRLALSLGFVFWSFGCYFLVEGSVDCVSLFCGGGWFF